MLDPELDRIRGVGIAADEARRSHAIREMRRHRGASWAGMDCDAPPPRSPAAIDLAAREKLERRRAWDQADGGFVAAVVRCQAAAKAAFSIAERARSGASRGEDSAWRYAIALELDTQARILSAAVRQMVKAGRG